MSAEDNELLAQRLYEAFNQGDLDAGLAMATDDVEVELVPFNQTFHCRQGFRDFMAGFKTAFPDLTIRVENQVASEDQVVSESYWTGTHHGPLQSPMGEIPASGKTVTDGRFCEVWEIRDGKVAKLRNYQDVSSWLRQLGLAP